MSQMDQFIQAFKQEAYELLTELESKLLELEERPDDSDVVNAIFRALHTIKGSGGMFGFDDISHFTHHLENAYDLIRSNKLIVTKEIIDVTLKSVDQIRVMLAAEPGDKAYMSRNNGIVSTVEAIIEGKNTIVQESAPIEEEEVVIPEVLQEPSFTIDQTPVSDESKTFRIRFKPSCDIFLTGNNPVRILNELRDLGDCKIFAYGDSIPTLNELNPEHSYTSWDIIITTPSPLETVKDVFIFVEGDSLLQFEELKPEFAEDNKKLGDILIERGDMRPEDVAKIRDLQKKFGEVAVAAGVVSAEKIQSALIEQQHVRDIAETQKKEEVATIRVQSDKLDQLVDLVGELVTLQARLNQLSLKTNDSELLSIAEESERLTSSLRDSTMSIRMVQIGSTFSKFKRLVRDLSSELGKEIELETTGGETELDKTVIEKLNDPLVHIIRNCIDHGIERPDERLSKNKNRKGIIHLSAMHSGASVQIKVTDDGHGLNKEAIFKKAVERGVITDDSRLSDKEIFELIFMPGFSTAAKITNVSGRGVGLDVVKSAIESLRGSIDITSQPGIGTTMILSLPLTLVIIDGLLVRIADDHYVIPLSNVEECVALSAQDRVEGHEKRVINIRGEIVPYIRLRERFRVTSELPDIEQIVIVRIEGKRIGFVVDHVIGENETVIKSLGGLYKHVSELSGATILGNGRVALILDVYKLSDGAEADYSHSFAELEG